MSAESEVAELLRADNELMAVLTGGVWTMEEIGVEGIKRGDEFDTNAAFDAEGYLLPCAVVRQRSPMPTSVRSHKSSSEFTATRQVVEIYFYQHRGHAMIDLAKERAYQLLESTRLSFSYPLIWDAETAYIPDVGPVKNSTTLRQEWVVYAIRRKHPA